MTFLILLGATAMEAAFLLAKGLSHLKESIGPWTTDAHEYDDAWRLAHTA
jgi:hypothetical protein